MKVFYCDLRYVDPGDRPYEEVSPTYLIVADNLPLAIAKAQAQMPVEHFDRLLAVRASEDVQIIQ